jgi:hypothetical protein
MKRKTPWIRLILLSIAIAIAGIIGITLYANSGDPRSLDRPAAVDQTIYPILRYGILLGIIGFVFLLIKSAVKSAIQESDDSKLSGKNSALNPSGFPIPTSASGVPILPDGPGQYRIQGVHRQTKMDISKYFQADSAANARVKAELDDIVVTSITKMQV